MSVKRFYIVFNSRSDDGDTVSGGHVVSTRIESIQDLLESQFDEVEPAEDCDPVPTTRYLLREKAGGHEDEGPNSNAWANYVLDPNEENTPYDTFEEATTALEALDG